MTLRERLGALDRVQKGRRFKLIASAVIVLLGIALVVAYAVGQGVRAADAGEGSSGIAQPEGAPGEAEMARASRPQLQEDYERMLADIRAGQRSLASVGVAAGVGVAVALVVVWLGLGLTYLALILAGGAIAGLVSLAPATRALAPMLLGVIALTAAFAALVQGLRMLLGASHPVLAIARTTLDEALRMKLSLVFVVMLVLVLASLPLLLRDDAQLRYRVQSFLQYASGGAFWIIAVLTVVFSVASVTADQRDKTIWQTLTKPVRAWHYVLGRWLGIWGLGLVLLGVSGSGIFLFVEYLRAQPAYGERSGQAYAAVAAEGSVDRLILETQILASRKSVKPEPMLLDEEQFEANVRSRVDQELRGIADGLRSLTPAEESARREELYGQIKSQLRTSVQDAYRTIEPGQAEIYVFRGLEAARDTTSPVILRFKINSGNNPPEAQYPVTFAFIDAPPIIRRVTLGNTQIIRLYPRVVAEDGTLTMQIICGDAPALAAGDSSPMNLPPQSITFPPDGLEVSVNTGGYRLNFLRVMLVLWAKLGFLAMLGVASATFLSFPVACLVSLGTFLTAEGAGYLRASLQNFSDTDMEGNVILVKRVITRVAETVELGFRHYAGLDPVGRLVEGLALPWGDVALGAGILLLWTMLLFLAGSFVLARREIAIYSGN